MQGRRSTPLTRNRRIHAALLIPALAVAVLAMAACGVTPQTTLEPTTEAARTARDLLMFVFWAMVVTFVLVEGALVYCLIRFRRRSGDGIPAQTHGNTPLEIGWTIAPAILVVVIVVLTVPAIFSNARAASPDALQVRAIGHQWWFEFQYPDIGVVTANELHLPVGRDVEIQLESNDVLHSFWVPSLRGKLDMVPGRDNRFTIKPEVTGTFPGQCAEFCGTAHALMKFYVVVETQAEFTAWAETQRANALPPASDLAKEGETNLTLGGCVACHTIRGTDLEGKLGPDLTHVGSRKHIAAGILENTPDNMRLWLSDPQGVKPGNTMVIPELSTEQLDSLVAYLQGLK
ncbi:MAG: cytochrome c oxidase subunit II [Chloroflexi bacterium]|nr:cytochrome c oxidase subunit II [Chloroflexota bacterium]